MIQKKKCQSIGAVSRVAHQRGPTAHRAAWCAALLCLAVAGASDAREEAERFVAGLRERGLHEMTLAYLERMETSQLADDRFRGRIGYHRGMTYLRLAREAIDLGRRDEWLKQALQELEQFASANSTSAAGAAGLTELANLFVQQGQQRVAEVDQLPDEAAYDERRQELQTMARAEFQQATPLFRQAESFYATALDGIPATLDPKTQSDLIETRRQYRGRLAQVSVLAAQSAFEMAATYPSNSREFRRLNEQTAEQLAKLYDQYSRWLVGLYARLYEGRCYQALGDYERALGCFEQLIGQPSVQREFRKLIASAYGHQAECLLAQAEFDTVIENCSAWLSEAHRDERELPEWLMVRYQLAEAMRRKAEAPSSQSAQQRRLRAEAQDEFRLVANSPGQFQRPARLAAASLRQGSQPERREPRDFAEAYEAGKEAVASINAAKMAMPTARRNNPDAVPELRMQMEQGKDDARRSFRSALSLVDDDTGLDHLNEVRYFLCWLSWENQQYYEAAVLGEFLARRYPDHAAAPAAAKVALAAYEQLTREATEDDESSDAGQFESRCMARVAELITQRWPDSRGAEAAFRVLVNQAIRTDRIEDARSMLSQVSESVRPAVESQLGNASWNRYLQLAREEEAARTDQATLDQLRSDAIEYLTAGIADADSPDQLTASQAASAIYLVQARLSEENYRDAIQLLEHPDHGPLAIVSSDHPAAQPTYAIEVYKAALRAYVSVTPPRADDALDTMARLEQAVAGSENEKQAEQLTRIYLSVAASLSEQLEQMHASGRGTEAARLTGAFAEFLDEVSARQNGNDWASRFWVARAYYQLGESLIANGSRESIHRYFAKARDEFLSLIAAAEADPSFAPSDAAVLAVRKSLGECYRQLGEYKRALDTFSAVLQGRQAQLSVQQAAAATYQQRGEAGDSRWLKRAIHGGYKLRSTGKNRIWGWLKLAMVAERASRSDPAYRDLFFESRLEAARCRYQIGRQAPAGQQNRHFAKASQSIRSLVQLYPEVGGQRWKARFDALLKQIQQSQSERPIGLEAFADRSR